MLSLPFCVLQHGKHIQIKGVIHVHSKSLDDPDITSFFVGGLPLWRVRKNQVLVSAHPPQKITAHRN